MAQEPDPLKEFLASKKFDVEHALGIHAYSYCHFPAESIYDPDLDSILGETAKRCHIYIVGYTPIIDLTNTRQDEKGIHIDFEILDDKKSVTIPIPYGWKLAKEDNVWFLIDETGSRRGIPNHLIFEHIVSQHGAIPFEVIYVGQAYGKNGSRSALDRLKKHETLQKIAIKGPPDKHKISIILIEINQENRSFTFFNPHAKIKSLENERISPGLDKLYNTEDAERVTLYEAALIRYFKPIYNKEFKHSFPSTNMKVLKDCYEKDFSGLIAEICFDDFEYCLFSECVEKTLFHIIQYDLHKEEDRKLFFFSKF